MQNGAIFVTIVADHSGGLHEEPAITGRGTLDEEGDEPALEAAAQAVAAAFRGLNKRRRLDDDAVEEAVRLAVRRSVTHSHGKRPLIDVHLLRV